MEHPVNPRFPSSWMVDEMIASLSGVPGFSMM
jgi:hypothetical protein